MNSDFAAKYGLQELDELIDDEDDLLSVDISCSAVSILLQDYFKMLTKYVTEGDRITYIKSGWLLQQLQHKVSKIEENELFKAQKTMLDTSSETLKEGDYSWYRILQTDELVVGRYMNNCDVLVDTNMYKLGDDIAIVATIHKPLIEE